ncbi:MAG: nicotinic acid mononucleotide adenylyltransferase, partial [Zoogloea sp.]|nr:nicotinic acid mononucleotide adenylyltransferase [Zoogloea sp.]
DDAEVLSEAPSYTFHTLERLRAQLGPQPSLVLLLGADAFRGLPDWFRWRELFGFVHVAVAGRPGYVLDPAELPAGLADEYRVRLAPDAAALARAPAGAIVFFDLTPLAISATGIRDRLAAGRSARYLAPQPVLDYIAEHSLYI